MAKKYTIDSLEKLLNVINPENKDRLAVDFMSWLFYYVQLIEYYRNQSPELTKGKSNLEIAKCIFKWVDDGKTGMNKVEVTSPDTGEVKTYNLTKTTQVISDKVVVNKETLTAFAHHLKSVMSAGTPWSIESAVDSFQNNH